jgi:hypothetical protein
MPSTSVTTEHIDKELQLCSSISNEPASCETNREKLATAKGGGSMFVASEIDTIR